MDLVLHLGQLRAHSVRVHVAESGLARARVKADIVLRALFVLVVIKVGFGHIHRSEFVARVVVLRMHVVFLEVLDGPVAVLLHVPA